MTQAILDGLRVFAFCDEHRHVGMAKVKKPHGFAYRCMDGREPNSPTEVGATQGTTHWCLKDETFGARRPSRKVFGDDIAKEPG